MSVDFKTKLSLYCTTYYHHLRDLSSISPYEWNNSWNILEKEKHKRNSINQISTSHIRWSGKLDVPIANIMSMVYMLLGLRVSPFDKEYGLKS